MKSKARWMLAPLLAVATLSTSDAEPELSIERRPDNALRIALNGASPGEVWTLQDSYDSTHWRDLGAIGAKKAIQENANAFVPRRFFRAARKEPATPQEALDQALQRWSDLNLGTYMYVAETSPQLGLLRELVSVVDGATVESLLLESPGFGDPFGPGNTIDELLQRIQGAIDSNAHRIDVRYHPSFGYPETVFIDFEELLADEEWWFWMRRSPQAPLPALEQNLALWNRRGPAAYQFHLEFQTSWWRWDGVIRVEDGVAMVLENGKAGAPSSDHIIRPIEGYFDLVRTAIEEEHVLSVAYDADYGFPIAISDDWYRTFADGPGERYHFSEFEVLETAEPR